MDLDLRAEIQLAGMDTIGFVPEMHYESRKASAVVNGFLPAASLSGGRFHTLEKEGSYLLDFEDFELEMQGYTLLKQPSRMGLWAVVTGVS